jgi:transcriptional regulator with XRE-family HTH domain
VLSGREKLKRWHYDVWCAILRAALAGEPDNVRFDYHPALHGPTVSHFTASSPEYLGWFKRWNEGKAYSDQIKPFGFLYILHLSRLAGHPDTAADPLDEADRDNDDVSPVAPFDKDLKAAVARAFDRSSPDHAPVDVNRLQTYSEMLAAYPFRAENKFLNGRPFDSGHTERRHILATSINLIGKEADRMDEEYVLGVRGELAIDYGGDPAEGARAAAQLRKAIVVHGKSVIASATGVSRGTLAKIERGDRAKTNVAPQRIFEALRRINYLRAAKQTAHDAELVRIKLIVASEGGIRSAARRLQTDPSNLSKRLRKNR